MPVEVLNAFEEAFGCTVLEGYGLSETSPIACFNHPGDERKAGSIGTPIRGVEMRLVDDVGHPVADGEVGEIWLRGDKVMNGYWAKPEATADAIRDGWFFTGDLARRDPYAYPREIEEVLHEHWAVLEVAVVDALPKGPTERSSSARSTSRPRRRRCRSSMHRTETVAVPAGLDLPGNRGPR